MTDPQPGPSRRLRRRGHRPAGPPAPASDALDDVAASAETSPVADDARTEAPSSSPPWSARQQRDQERGWRDLVGNTPSLVGVSGAMRARDVARPTEDDLAAAERDVVIVRRDWKPAADDPGFTQAENRSSRKP